MFDIPLVAFDSETERFGCGCMAPRSVCWSFAWREDDGLHTALRDHEQGPRELAELLCRAAKREVMLVGHNVAYDLAVLVAHNSELWPLVWDAYEAGGVYCTQVAEWLLDTAAGLLRMEWNEETGEYKATKSYALERLAIQYLAWPPYKDEWRLRYGELRGIPIADWPEAARAYPLRDADATLGVAEHQLARAHDFVPHDPLAADLARQVRAYFALHLVSCWGLALDFDAVRDLEAKLSAKACEHEAELERAGYLVRAKTGKSAGKVTKKLAAVRADVVRDCEARGVEVATTPTGEVKISGTILDACTSPALQHLAAWSEVQKTLTSFARPFSALGAGIVHSRYGFAATGRTTCSGGGKRAEVKGLNVQQMPRAPGVRECFVPRAGHVFSSTDYAALELCTFAEVLLKKVGYSRMAEAINDGADLHSRLGAQLMRVTEEVFLDRLKAGDKTTKDFRQYAKSANFGYPGGMGAARFVEAQRNNGVDFSESFARSLKAEWMRAWPEVKDYFDIIGKTVGEGTATIVQLYSNRIRGGVGFTDAANTFFQGLAADGAKAALWKIVRECYDERLSSPLLGSRVVAFMHDEFLAEHPIERAHDAATRLAEVAIDVMREWTPNVAIKAEPALMERWHKAAETKRDERGRLVVWRPE